MNWRKVKYEDYQNILTPWWTSHNWEAPPLEFLPEGYIVSNNGIDVYASFIYYTGTSIAWLEFTVCNPDAKIEDKKGCLEYLISIISTIAKDKGVKVLFTSTDKVFANALKKRGGFEIKDKECIQLIKTL